MKDPIERQAAIEAVSHGCQEWRGIFGRCEENILALPPAQPEQQWIPCSERLPEHPGVYLVTLTAYAEKRVVARWYWPQRGGWVSDERPEAWMPLPEPYQKEAEQIESSED